MAKKKCVSSFTSIKHPEEPFAESKINLNVTDDCPLFCFKHFQHKLIKENKMHEESLCFDFLERLQKLSELGWKEIRKSSRHSFGMEKIPKSAIIPSLPSVITDDVKDLHVLRATGGNLPFVGLQVGRIFHILFLEPVFDTVYKH